MTVLFLSGSILSHAATETQTQVAHLAAAAMNGDPSAQFELALLYDNGGADIKKSEKAAIYWYTQAAEQGDACAAYNLGVCYENKGDYDKAIEWYRLSEKNGDADAMTGIASCYYCKYVTSTYSPYFFITDRADRINNLNKAVEWAIKAENKGLSEAKTLLGIFYLIGTKYTAQDIDKAKTLFRIAACMGEGDEVALQALRYLGADRFMQKYVEHEILCLTHDNFTELIAQIESKVDIDQYIKDQFVSNDLNHLDFDENTGAHFPEDFAALDEKIGDTHKSHLQFLIGLWYYYHPDLEERNKCIDWWRKANQSHHEIIVRCIGKLVNQQYIDREKLDADNKLLFAAEEHIANCSNELSEVRKKLNEKLRPDMKKRSSRIKSEIIIPITIAFISSI